MERLKQVLVRALVGAFLGVVIASIAAPTFISWYATPGFGHLGFDVSPLVHQVLSTFLLAQLGGAAAGAVLLSAALWLVGRRRGSRAAPDGPAARDDRAAS